MIPFSRVLLRFAGADFKGATSSDWPLSFCEGHPLPFASFASHPPPFASFPSLCNDSRSSGSLGQSDGVGILGVAPLGASASWLSTCAPNIAVHGDASSDIVSAAVMWVTGASVFPARIGFL